ncbi:response regulator transcription factor [Pantoea dispersa]|jgi:two-component system, NarL family, response regulator, fimbrial Z protein, FimZ|uniref:response regulator transcription factor n=1 Tax=Pantoea dispersa TaxID=59814 RepID=UPI0021AE64FD|nr:response regulator transcription factor [Pantoea dispersa]MCT6589901.1 response regulator transcription factor [Pantoea dispersa]MCW0320891.1 DNA-binding transcriptional activator EvgA [Pantoea dispersa]MCW0325627.1 DNA-binding transcriptional activator EvgA [Pantoea dispersa]MCW0430644.1 DNA-binding transcriptional activator EvgA [Pantoea dispersa]
MAALLLIDDHPLVEVALEAACLNAPISLQLYAAGDEAQARQLLQQHHIDLIVLDIGLPDSDGLELLRRLRARHPQCPVLIYSAQQSRHTLLSAASLGAAGYVVKSQSMAQLLSAILAVLGGQQAFPPLPERIALPLTEKEQQIVALLVRGLSNIQIGEQLHISNKTVSTHKKNILEKTGVQSVVELAELWKAQQ